jgi:hypothetical protein
MQGWTRKAAVYLAMTSALALAAQSGKPPILSEQQPRKQTSEIPAQTPKGQPAGGYKVPLLAEGLRLSDFAGMTPRPELVGKLLGISGFIQKSPRDGQPATEKTEVWLGRTKSALYFVFICYDSHPEQIRGHLARRENVLNDDNVSVLLDPFQDRRKGFLFTVNPAGVQADAAWDENNGTDYSYNQIWDSDGQAAGKGWMALVAIPFRSLRFRPESQGGAGWGVVFMRNFPRNSETDYWPRVSDGISGTLSQEGTLAGIEGVTGSHNVQINPYLLGQNERTLETVDPLDPYISSRRFEGTAGGEAKAILKDSIVLDATIYPDFSDVESDQPQFTVDQRYSVYFQELRPFFLENANYFTTPINLVYTRNISHPEFGGRVTGKIRHTNLGLFAIDDREPGQAVAPGDPLHNKRALFAVGRVSQDFGKNLSIGAIYTDKEFGQGWNRIGGVDFTWRATSKWTAQGQTVESSTKGDVDSGTPPTYSAGPASYLFVRRTGHAFSFNSSYLDYSTGFQTQLGYIQTANIRHGQTYIGYAWFPKHKKLQSFGVETSQDVAYDHEGNRVYHYSSFDPYFLLPRNIVLAPIGGQNSDTVGPPSYSALTQYKNFTENFGGFIARGAPFSQFNFNVTFYRCGNVNYYPAAGHAPFLLNQQYLSAQFTLQPLRQLTVDNTYLLDRDYAATGGAFVYESQVFRTKVNYQFTRSWSARVIAEYDSTLANAAETSIERTKQVNTKALLTWLPHPGTAVYLGYNNDLQNLDRRLCKGFPGGVCDSDNTIAPRSPHLMNDSRQIFVKASYLLRF